MKQLPTRFTRSQLEQQQKLRSLYTKPHQHLNNNNNKNNNYNTNNSQQTHSNRIAKQNFLDIEESREDSDESMAPIPSIEHHNERGGRRNNDSKDNSNVSELLPEVTPQKEDDDIISSPTKEQPRQSAEESQARAQRKANWPLTNITEPGLHDCLFGRGGGTNHHPGNKRYRKMVDNKKETYLTSKRLDKPLVAMEIINEWRSLDPPGRFLKQDEKTKYWNDVGDKKAREKTSQALREKTPPKQREEENNNNQHHRDTRTAHFEPGTASPTGTRRRIKQLSLARDHSLGTEIVGANEISLEGFSWDDPNEGGEGGGNNQQQHLGHPPDHHQFPPQYYHHNGGGPGPHPAGEQQQYYQHHPHLAPPPYQHVRDHSLSNNQQLPDANVAHPAPQFRDPSKPPPPPPPPHYQYGPPPPPPHHPYYYSPSQQHDQFHMIPPPLPPPPLPQQPTQRSREHSLQMNPLKGASTEQPGKSFNEEALQHPPPPPPHYYGYPPVPHQHGWPAPPGIGPIHQPPNSQFMYPGSNPSAFGRYDNNQRKDGDRKDSLYSLGSSVDMFYDQKDNQRTSNASSTSRMSVDTTSKVADDTRNKKVPSPPRENPASAGTSQDYSKIADLIRDSSDKSSSTKNSVNNKDKDDTANEGKKGEDKSEKAEPRQPSLIRKISGGAMGRNAASPPAGIMRPQPVNATGAASRPEVVKRDTSNQPETLETKRSVKRVVLSRDKSEVSRSLKAEQITKTITTVDANGGVRVVTSKLTKAEMLDRKMSVEMDKLGLEDTAIINPALGRTTTEAEAIYKAVDGAPALGRMTTDAFLTSLIDSPPDGGETTPATPAAAAIPPPLPAMGGRLTTIDAIALDITMGVGEQSGSWDDDASLGLNENEAAVNADIAEKWLRGESS